MGTTNLDFSSMIRKEGAYPENEARGEFEREEFVKKTECQTESKALEKSTEAKMVRSGGFFFWKPSQID